MNTDIDKQQEENHSPINLKYSKSSSYYFSTKQKFFTENDKILKKSHEKNQLYIAQPIRNGCKICDATLPNDIDFHSHGVDYVFCLQCTHLNGRFEDSQEFIENLYISDGGSDYSHNYIDEGFYKRVIDIYIPKIDFLVSSIPPKKYAILDVGCGSGYFVYAALLRNLNARGLDVSEKMVEFGNHQIYYHLKESPLSFENEQGFYKEIIKSNAQIISAIGVIEHLREPHMFFDAFKQSNAKYLFYSVPMFSFSAVLENVFKDVFPRQLSGGHTHLFTEQSIAKMNELIGVKTVSEWRFGTDVIDLYRHILVNLQKNNASQKMMNYLFTGFGKKIDKIQSIFDKNHFCSEIHCVASKI